MAGVTLWIFILILQHQYEFSTKLRNIMKKQILRGAVTLVLGGCFAGCSHDDIDYSSIIDSKLQAYQEVFVDAYGKIDPNQSWGFGSVQEGTRKVTRAISMSFSDPFVFPGDADASKFLADVPEGVEKLSQTQIGRANHWIDESWTDDVNIYGAATEAGNWQDRSGGKLYIKGNCDFSNRRFYFDGNSELFLLEGATLTLNSTDAANLQVNTNIYIAEGASIVTTSELKLNNGLHIYNHGTIEAGIISTNSNSVLINTGIVTVVGKISVENDLSVVVNDGDLIAAELNTAGSGKFQNNGNATISGNTTVNSNGNTWVNNGQYHTGYFIYNAASDQVINNCRLTVDEDFDINLGDNPGNGCFRMDAGSGVVTKNFNGGGNFTYAGVTFNGGPFYIFMGSGSVFKVTETATMNATKADYGVYNLGDDWSVFLAKDIVAGTAEQGYEVTYGGKIGIVAETHFAQGYSGAYPYIDFKYGCSPDNIYAEGFNGGTPTITVSGSTCNPGYGTLTIPIDQSETSEDRVTIVTTREYYETTELIEQGRVFCEDLGRISTNDLDFNDVVFDAYVYRTVPSTRTIITEDGVKTTDETVMGEAIYKTTIILLAAGGTLPLSVAESYEVHNVLGGNPTSTIINTIGVGDESYGNSYVTHAPVTIGTDFNYSSIVEIPIWVRYGNGEVLKLTAEQGWAPHKILVPIGTKWAKERVKIDSAYGDFMNYVSYSEDCWKNNISEDNVYTHPMDTYKPRSTEAVTVRTNIEGPTTTYRNKGTSTTTGGYEGEEILSRKVSTIND